MSSKPNKSILLDKMPNLPKNLVKKSQLHLLVKKELKINLSENIIEYYVKTGLLKNKIHFFQVKGSHRFFDPDETLKTLRAYKIWSSLPVRKKLETKLDDIIKNERV